ncbi:MAG: cupredoxin domain-containing protein, partial [Paenibacillaceae bacterium]|nr:cupredoxin domain-containing protein [Paenibacillaceae bacterium]
GSSSTARSWPNRCAAWRWPACRRTSATRWRSTAAAASRDWSGSTSVTASAYGTFMTDGKGMSLYFFAKDPADPNACQAACLANWPVFYAERLQVPAALNAASFGVLTRADGAKQTTYNGWPLYYFVKDKAPGDVNGEASGKVWYLAKPYSVTFAAYGALGNFLVDGSGRTLYYFDKDSNGNSACSGQCLTNWPAFYAETPNVPAGLAASDFGTLIRPDGTPQTTYKGFPLYYFAKDTKAGMTSGQAVNNVWYVVDPAKFQGTSTPNTAVKLGHSDQLGPFLTDANGMALYYYTKDSADRSVCTDKCLAAWPLFYTDSTSFATGLDAADFGTVTRDDGKKQTTYRGYPLYYYVKDTMSGQTSGQDVGKVWYVIDPAKFHGAMSMPMPTTTEPKPTDQPQPAATGSAHTIYMENYAFSESVITVSVGDTVTFTNKDEDAMHNAVAVDGSFSTRLLAAGESATITLTKAGEYDYYCEPHKPFMKAKIIVK